jgi:hypothetical protein
LIPSGYRDNVSQLTLGFFVFVAPVENMRPSKRYLSSTLVLVSWLMWAPLAHPEIIRGSVSMLGGSWIFNDGNCGCPPCDYACNIDQLPRLDLKWIYIFDPPLGNALCTPVGGQPLGDVPLDSVEVAPTAGYAVRIDSSYNEEFQVNRTYVLKTRDGGHALIRPSVLEESTARFVFDYIYQNDGTGVFTTGTAIQITTWSSIKTRYHN